MPRYYVEIYGPGQCEDPPILSLESDVLPMPISTGDLINLRAYGHALQGAGTSLLQVIKIEHFFWDGKARDNAWEGHKIMVFTTAVPDAPESRIPGYPHAP